MTACFAARGRSTLGKYQVVAMYLAVGTKVLNNYKIVNHVVVYLLALQIASCSAELNDLFDNARVIVFAALLNAFNLVYNHGGSYD